MLKISRSENEGVADGNEDIIVELSSVRSRIDITNKRFLDML